MRTNTYDAATGNITVNPIRKRAFDNNLAHYAGIFTNGSKEYAIQKNAQSDPVKLRKLTAFFFWTAWASTANRPGDTISYTSNFPSEPLVGNVPASSAIIWTGVSVILLISGIGGMVWFYAGWHKTAGEQDTPHSDPLINEKLTPSQKATVKYFMVVSLLFLLQIIMGIITAHYGVEGGGFYGIPLQDYLPYAVTRTWHTQLGIFWIATAWLAAGLFIAPYICGYEPKFQKLGVDVLFAALLVVVLGSMGGQWMSVMHILLLFCLRAMQPERKWNTRLLSFAFWAINIGMLMEIFLSLLPIGLLQTYQSVSQGYWYARSSEFMQTELMQTLRWMRLFGDTIFAIGAIAFVWFAVELMIRKKNKQPEIAGELVEA